MYIHLSNVCVTKPKNLLPLLPYKTQQTAYDNFVKLLRKSITYLTVHKWLVDDVFFNRKMWVEINYPAVQSLCVS